MAQTVLPGLERRLKAQLLGDVHFDAFTRGRYATDASHYQIMPLGVVAPQSLKEAEYAIALAREEGVSVLARGGGTSQSGQTVNKSLVIDCSKYLDHILDLDVVTKRCVVEPGIVLDELNRRLRPHGLWFPVDISTASRAPIGGTLGFSTKIELRLSPLLGRRAVGAVHFGSFHAAMEAAQHIVKLGPIAVELIDRTMLGLAREIAMFRPTIDAVVRNDPEAILFVEFAEDDQYHNLRRLMQLRELMGDLGLGWNKTGAKWGGVLEVFDPNLQA